MNQISLARPSITDEEIQAVERALRSRWLTYGPENRAFEEELAAACGKRFCLAVSSGTAALHLSLLAWKDSCAKAEDFSAALSPAFTFPATANVAGFLAPPPKVHLADVDQQTFCLPSETINAWHQRRSGPVLVVHQFGYPCPVPLGVSETVISDAACAVAVPGAMVGRLVCLSFHPRKLLTTGEGGAVLTDEEELYQRLQRLRSHGLYVQAEQETMSLGVPGLNYRLSEPQAAMGRVQLRRLPRLVAYHRELADKYRLLLSDTPLRFQADHPHRIWQTFAVVLPGSVRRQAVRAQLKAQGIETQVASYGLHRLAFYENAPRFPKNPMQSELSVSTTLHDQGLALPLHADLSFQEVERVCTALKKILSFPQVLS